MGYSNHDKMEWTLILALEFGRRPGILRYRHWSHRQRPRRRAALEESPIRL